MKSFSFCLLVVGAVSLVTCWRCADASVTGSCFNAELYMRTETINIMKTLKRLFMMSSTNNAPPNADDITPCLGGDLLVDLFTARYLQYSSTRRHKRALFVNFTAQPEHKWNTTIPYYFNFTGVTTDTLISALQYVEQQTCIRFTAASGFTIPYLSVMLGASCTTFMGRSTDTIATPFIVTTACANTFGEIINLLANVLGMLPENLRPDRDAYIYVNSSNIDSSDLANLQPVPGFINASIYDYASVTHAYSKQFASGAGYTILPYDPLYLKVIGQHVEWSFLDAKAVNFFYCNDVCSSSLSCERGGYVDPNNCAQCRCPDGFAGTTCQSLAPQSNGNCGSQQELTATSSDQYITSPGYSTRYGIYTNCTWRISAPSSSLKIQLKFVDAFGIFEDASTSACCHWVEIRYKGSLNTTGPRFCGRQRPPNSLVTDAREVLVLFRSNYNADSIENVGFKLLYRLVTCDPAWSTTVRPNSNSVGAELVSYPLSESGCRDHCAYDLPGCVAVDIDHNKRPYPACWVHVNAGDLDQVYTTNGVTQHRINTTYPDCRVSTSGN